MLGLSAILLLVSGIAIAALDHSPAGNGHLHSWTHSHIIGAFIFTILGIWHLALNWRPMPRRKPESRNSRFSNPEDQ